MSLNLENEVLDTLLIFRTDDEISSQVLNTLKAQTTQLVRETGIYRILINMNHIEYISSKDITVFVQILKFLNEELENSGNSGTATLALCNLSDFVADVLKMTRLETVFKIFGTEAECIEALDAGAPE